VFQLQNTDPFRTMEQDLTKAEAESRSLKHEAQIKKDGADGWMCQSASPLSLMRVAHTSRASAERASSVLLCSLGGFGAAGVNVAEGVGRLSVAVPVGEWLDTDRFWTPDVRCANTDSGARSVSPPLLVSCWLTDSGGGEEA